MKVYPRGGGMLRVEPRPSYPDGRGFVSHNRQSAGHPGALWGIPGHFFLRGRRLKPPLPATSRKSILLPYLGGAPRICGRECATLFAQTALARREAGKKI